MKEARTSAPDTPASARTCLLLREAVYARSRGKHEESLHFALHAESMIPRNGHTVLRGFADSEIAISLLRNGNVLGSLARMVSAYHRLSTHLSAMQLATLSIGLGLAYSRAENHQKAAEVLTDVVALNTELIGERNSLTARLGLGTALQQLGRHDIAIEYYHSAITVLNDATRSAPR